MNQLLHQITWHQYLTAAFIIAVIYYLTIILRCYRPELQNLQKRISGHKPEQALQTLQYQPADGEALTKAATVTAPSEYPQHDQTISASDILGGKLKTCIAKAADKPFAPAVLIPQLKEIFQDHPHIAADERPAINHLVVNECEKTGTALLTEDEVDQWWER